MTDVPQLKKCPFCRSSMHSFAGMTPESFARSSAGDSFAVNCDCGAIGPFAPDMDQAIAAWNTRADLIDMDVLARVEERYETLTEQAAHCVMGYGIGKVDIRNAMLELKRQVDESRATISDLRAMMEKLK